MVRNDAEKEKKEVQREKFSQVATSPGAQVSQKSTSLKRPADTCPAKGEVPAQPGTVL